MPLLFSEAFSQNQITEVFTIVQLSDNLFQAKSSTEIVLLWKNKEAWDGVSNLGESAIIQDLGKAIDKQLTSTILA